MSGAAEYILTVTAGAMIVAILKKLAREGAPGAMMRLLGGIFMALTILSPVLKLEIPDPKDWLRSYDMEASAAVLVGVEMEMEARRAIITKQTRAYIMDKAASLGASPEVHVELGEDMVPAAVTLTGDENANIKEKLIKIIGQSLGLGEEAVTWIEPD